MSSSGSHEEAAAALDALAWIDEEEAFAFAQMLGWHQHGTPPLKTAL